MPEKKKAHSKKPPIGIAGSGKLAQALGKLLRRRGEPVAVLASRNQSHAKAAAAFIGKRVRVVPYSQLPLHAERILIAVSDDSISKVAALLAQAGMCRGMALHTSGALGPEALAPLAVQGVSCATLHPLQTVASPEQGVAMLPGVSFGITGGGPAAAWAEQIAALLEGEALRIPAERRPLYHAAAVMASNYIAGMIDAAVSVMGAAGIKPKTALAALAPLVRASSVNALSLSPARALTGPIARGDFETVRSHWLALAEAPETVRELYRSAGLHVVELARRGRLAESQAQELRDLLRQDKDANA